MFYQLLFNFKLLVTFINYDMENLKYNLHKIATNNKLLIEVLADKTILNKQQHEKDFEQQ